MRLWRIAQAIPWRTAMLIALAISLIAIPSWTWFTWELPPLERYYLRAYWQSSESRNNPEAVIEVQWLELTAPNRKSQWPIDSFVTGVSLGDVPVELSSHALKQGWTGIEESSPYSVGAAHLEGILRQDFFHGQSFREVVSEPASYGCIALFVVLLIAWKMRDEIGSEWGDLWHVLWEAESVWDSGWNVPSNKHENLSRIWNRITRRFASFKASIEQFPSLVAKSSPSSARSRVDSHFPSTHARSSLGADHLAPSSAPRPANLDSSLGTNTAPLAHLVLPGASLPYVRQKDLDEWHESDWIE